MAKSKKYYVVWKGAKPGIYDSWDECKLNIQGFPGAKYKSYKSAIEAADAYKHGDRSTSTKKPKSKTLSKSIVKDSIAVDAACSGNPGNMEYQGVKTVSGELLFHFGPIPMGTNNIGEFLAIVHALAGFSKSGNKTTPIYTDSRTAMAWVRKKKANTKLFEKTKNPPLEKLISRAEEWLKNNTHRNPILKWDTKNWGEIPADFGRK